MFRKYLRKTMAAVMTGGTLTAAAATGHPVFAAPKKDTKSMDPFKILDVMADCSFEEISETAYFKKDSSVYLQPFSESAKAGAADRYAEVHVTGTNKRGFWRITDGKRNYYVKAADVTTDRTYVDDAIRAEEKAAEEAAIKAAKKAKKELQEKKDMLDDDEARMKPKAWKAFQEKIKEIEKKQSSSSDDSEAEKKALSDKSTMSSFSTSEAFKTAPTNAQKIWVFLTEHGFTDVQAAAILGNIQAESDFNPRATDGGLGLIQWIGGRASNLRRYAGNSMWTIEGQLTFMIHELNTYESTAYAKLKAAKTPAEGAYVWDRYFERSAGWSTRTRMKNAVKWYNTFHNGKVLKDMETIETGSADSKSKTDTGQSGSKTDTKKTSSESKSNKENKENKKDNEIKKTDKTDQKKQETENTKKSESGKTESAGTDTAASSTGTATAGSQTSADAVGNTQTTANSAVSQSSDASAQTQNPSVSA